MKPTLFSYAIFLLAPIIVQQVVRSGLSPIEFHFGEPSHIHASAEQQFQLLVDQVNEIKSSLGSLAEVKAKSIAEIETLQSRRKELSSEITDAERRLAGLNVQLAESSKPVRESIEHIREARELADSIRITIEDLKREVVFRTQCRQSELAHRPVPFHFEYKPITAFVDASVGNSSTGQEMRLGSGSSFVANTHNPPLRQNSEVAAPVPCVNCRCRVPPNYTRPSKHRRR